MNVNRVIDWVQAQDASSALYWVGVGLGVVLLIVLAAILRLTIMKMRAGTSEQKSERMTAVIFLLALAVNADAMWRVATEKLSLPWYVAAGVFAVFELLQLNSMRLARASYKERGYPGVHAQVVWGVAVASSAVTLANSRNPVEAIVRLVLPLTVAAVWHASLVANGVKRRAGKFRYSPHRVMVTLGLIEPEEDIDYQKISRERLKKKLVAQSYRVERGIGNKAGIRGWLQKRRLEKLQKVIIVADQSLIDAAVGQLRAGRYGLANLVPSARLLDQSQLEIEAERLVDQSRQSRGQSGPVATGSRGDQSDQSWNQSRDQSADQLQLPVGQSGQSQSDYQLLPQSTLADNDPDEVLVIKVRELIQLLGRAPKIVEVRRAISLEPGTMAGPERAKRIMRKMGLREE